MSYQADHGVFLDPMARETSTPWTAETTLGREKRTDNTTRLTDEWQSSCPPCVLPLDVLDRIHDAHQGIAKCYGLWRQWAIKRFFFFFAMASMGRVARLK